MTQHKDSQKEQNQLREQLGYLKLQFIQEHFDELARQAALSQWSHVEFLTRLIEGENAQRQDRARERRIKLARFPVIKTLEQFDYVKCHVMWSATRDQSELGPVACQRST